MSPGRMQEAESEKLDQISSISSSLLELKKRYSKLAEEKENLMRDKLIRLKKNRIEEHKQKASQLDEKERELCRRTNELVDKLLKTSDDSPFHRALMDVLGNMKGKIKNFI